MVMHYKININRLCKVIVLVILLLFYYFVRIKGIVIPCLFRNIFHMYCPMCGLTRSIMALLDGNIILSLRYNLLGIVLFLFIVINILLLVYDIIFNKKIIEYIYRIIGKYYILIIVILIINMIINNIRGI